MKKIGTFLGFALALTIIIVGLKTDSFARLTGTNPGTDVFCIGPSGAEVCVDGSGNIVPTTTNDASAGSSSLRFSNVFSTLLNVSGASTLASATFSTKIIGPYPTVQVLGTGSIGDVGGSSNIVAGDACGGVKRIRTYNLASNALIGDTSNAFTNSTTAGCVMDVINIGSQNIKLSPSTQFLTLGGVAMYLTASDSIRVFSSGSDWVQIGTVIAAQ